MIVVDQDADEQMLGVWLVQNWNGSQITGLAVQLYVRTLFERLRHGN